MSDSSKSTRLSLLEGVQRNDSLAWERFVSCYGSKVYGWCRKQGVQPEDAKELTQDVFRSVFEAIENFQSSQSHHTLRGWLYTITTNKVIDFKNKQFRAPMAIGGSAFRSLFENFPYVESGSISASANSNLARILGRVVDDVRESVQVNTWQAFWLTTVEQLDATEAGKRLNMTPVAVRVAKHRVVAMLRKSFEEERIRLSHPNESV